MTWLKSIVAIFAGMVVVVVFSEGTDWMLRSAGIFPADGTMHATSFYLVALAHRCVWGVAGSAVAARLAPTRPMLHALVLGAIGAALNVLGLIAMWSVGDHWYPAALAATALPCGWLGARLAAA